MNTKDFIIPILIVLEIIWFTFAYLFYKAGNSVENPIKYILPSFSYFLIKSNVSLYLIQEFSAVFTKFGYVLYTNL